MSERALIARVRLGDEHAFEVLYGQYEGLIRINVQGLGTRSLEHDDIMQVAALAFYRAVHTFDPARRMSFRNYAVMAVQRASWTAIRMALRQKHQVLNESTSLAQPIADGGQLADALPGSMAQEPATILIAREAFARQLKLLTGGSRLERVAVIGVANGLTYREIAERAGRDEKAIDNAIQRSRSRLRRAA
jgi:RNA polymerase sporulation-specific sigma factor